MGSGDLNMKKSWHPQRSGNIAATQKAETEAIAERKKLQQRLQEIEEERKKEEIQKALEAAGGKPRLQRVEWMYSGPTDGQTGDAAENEAYLLGKRRIDKLLQDNDVKKLKKDATQETLAAAPAAAVANSRDMAAKIREDPLLAIKRQEQQAYEAMMNDPIKRRQLLASMGIEDPQDKTKSKEERRHKHRHSHHRSHRHHEDDRDGERGSRRRRSDSRDRSRSPRRDGSEDASRKRRRRDSRDRRRDRSRSADSRERRDGRGRRGSREREERRDRRGGSREDGYRDGRSRVESRSASPPPRRRDYSPDRDDRRRGDRSSERSGPSRRQNENGGSYRNGNSHQPRRNYDDRHNRGPQRPQNRGPSNAEADREKAEEERARKLAAMQAAATDLDEDRERRLALLAEKERINQEIDDRARQRNKRLGGDAGFMNQLHSRAAELKVADRVGRR
ncbi:Pre-mRNA splicing factor-domain-containing protein [Staphylotrichum tortipilum]|uniref:Pre-mRNA splicing factor-domain-containing protein n=1 Tax=Staphylotrichum tortipilum TaxID=2831512 RepID=A0AAN6RRM7_9PEZI|nr:Pre-mRNA splicing factor-domain-containing protein [Staphylotrichum longicolle]